MKNPFFKKQLPAWLIIISALLLVLLCAKILSWQYYRMEEKEFSVLEGKIEDLSARGVLKDFMEARIDGDEDQAIIYLTEEAMTQKVRGDFNLVNDFKSYTILNTEKLDKDKFRFKVKIYKKIGHILETITLIKVFDKYYVDSAMIVE